MNQEKVMELLAQIAFIFTRALCLWYVLSWASLNYGIPAVNFWMALSITVVLRRVL